MKLLFALVLIIVGVALLAAAGDAVRHPFKNFDVYSSVGHLARKYPMTEEDKLAAKKAVQHVEYFRRLIHTGIATIPPLDPYKIQKLETIHLNGNGTLLTGTLQVSDLALTGAADFSVNGMEMYLKTHRIDFNMKIPQIVAKAHYSAVNMMYDGFVFNMSGHIEVVMEDYWVRGAVSIATDQMIPQHYMTTGLKVHVAVTKGWFDMSTWTSSVGNPSKSNAVEQVRDAVFNAVSEAVVRDLNHVFLRYTVPQVDTFMKP